MGALKRQRFFLVNLGKFVPTSKVKKIAEMMELTKDESDILIYRFCNGMTREQLAFEPFFIPVDKQYRMLKKLDVKVKAWYSDHKEFFNDIERDKLDQYV